MLINRKFHFDAAHKLHEVGPEKCKRLHGHTYRMEVSVRGEIRKGMVLDFGDLDRIVKETVLARWDHQYLNERVPEGMETTVENLVTLAAELIAKQLPAGVELAQVTMWEGLNSSAVWQG